MRSKRYALKLKNRVFGQDLAIEGDDGKDLENARQVGGILRKGDVFSLKVNYSKVNELVLSENSKKLLKKAFSQGGRIYFIHVENYSKKKCHAEEFLCDIGEYAKSLSSNGKFHTGIAGKKRPCMGCFGRMKSANISNYGGYPGRFFMNTIEMQSTEVAISTLRQMVENSSHVSLGKDGETPLTDYDSGSDSEPDLAEYENTKMSQFT